MSKALFEELDLTIAELKKENQELKKKLEIWEQHLKCSKEMLEIQGRKGNYDYDEYMLGLYNGMEYIIALFEERESNFRSGRYIEFTNSKSQQKEFINYLEDEISSQCKHIEELKKWQEIEKNTSNDDFDLYIASVVKRDLEKCLQKYKEIIEVK